MITKEQLEQHLTFQEEINEIASIVLRQYQAIRNEVLGEWVNKYLHLKEINESHIEYYGEEYHRSCLTDSYCLSLPASYLYDPNYELDIRQKALIKKERLNQKKRDNDLRQRNADFEALNKLKAKLGL